MVLVFYRLCNVLLASLYTCMPLTCLPSHRNSLPLCAPSLLSAYKGRLGELGPHYCLPVKYYVLPKALTHVKWRHARRLGETSRCLKDSLAIQLAQVGNANH